MTNTPLPIIASGCGGATVAAASVQLTSNGNRRYQRIVNAGPGRLWVTRDPLTEPTIGGPGCWAIEVDEDEEYPIAGCAYVPAQATFGVSESTSNVAVEVN